MYDARSRLVNDWINYFRTVAASFTVPTRFEVDDCVQECCITLLNLLQEIDPTDPDFEQYLKRRINCALLDLHRDQYRKRRDVRRNRSLPDSAKERLLDPAPDSDPCDLAAARDAASEIKNRLKTKSELMMFQEMMNPGDALRRKLLERGISLGKTTNRVPLEIYAEVTGLSRRQCDWAIQRIRHVARSVFMEEPCLF